MKAFLYLRVSSEEQARHGYSLEAQETALKEFCDQNHHIILGIYRDEGISGRKPYTKRPAMMQLLDDLEMVKPNIILFTKLDRWFRSVKEYYKVQDILDKNKVDWKAIHEEYDTSTASGRLYVNIKLSIAQDEADRTSERIKAIQAQQIAQGKVLGGNPPFGYKIENKRIVFGENIHIVREAIDHYMMHQSMRATARYINDLHGLNMTTMQFSRLFRSTILKGEYRGNTAYCEPLISPQEWDKLQLALSKNVKQTPSKRVYLFTGLLRCPKCGRNFSSCTDGRTKRYRCQCYRMGICDMAHSASEKKIEAYLLDHIEKDFDVQVRQKPKRKKESPKKYRDRLKRLNDIYLLGNITETEYRKKSADLQRTIAELSKEPKQVEDVFVANWKDVYKMLDEEHRRAFWRNLVSEIKINDNGDPVGIICTN